MDTKLSERSRGAYALLRIPRVYSLLQRAIGGDHGQNRFVAEVVRPTGDARVVDFGAGTASIRRKLPAHCAYTAIEPNASYCNSIAETYDSKFTAVRCGGVETLEEFSNEFDVALVVAVLHHVDDNEARRIIQAAHTALRANGRLITLDPCFHDRQPPVARFLARVDRGPYVRTIPEYMGLAEGVFEKTSSRLEPKYLRVPYSTAIIEYEKQ
jgi:SAM-dependent methyltransferase